MLQLFLQSKYLFLVFDCLKIARIKNFAKKNVGFGMAIISKPIEIWGHFMLRLE